MGRGCITFLPGGDSYPVRLRGGSMSTPSADPTSPLALSCPECGELLSSVPDHGDVLCCPSHHRFTLPSLILGQSRRVATLCETGARLLEEQERLVRQIAEQLWNSQPLAAFRLEGRADQLRETG